MSTAEVLQLPVPERLQSLLKRQRVAFEARGEPTALVDRQVLLSRLEETLMAERLRLCEAMSADFGGRPYQESLLELFVVLDDIRFARSNLRRWMKTRKVAANWQMLPSRACIIPQPLGVIGVIGAYNYPVMTALSPVVAALAAGNHVMLKPSDLTPKTAALLREILSPLFAEEQFAVVVGDAEVSRQFTRLAFDHLMFTGSTRVGKLVMQAAAENLVPVTLELGGKSPVIVGEDFDLKTAAESVVQSKFLNAGQTCVAGDFAMVPEAKVPEFLEHVRNAIKAFYPKLVDNRDYGRVINAAHWQRLASWVDDARVRGARVETFNPAGEACSADNRVFPPTVVSGYSNETALAREEVFGPVLPVQGYRTLDEAIARVNAGERPLALYMFSNNQRDIDRVLRRTIAGGVGINGMGFHAIQHRLPFGGVGASGIGAYRGQIGFDRFSHLKPVLYTSKLTKASVLLRPPFGAVAAWVLGFMLHNKPKREVL